MVASFRENIGATKYSFYWHQVILHNNPALLHEPKTFLIENCFWSQYFSCLHILLCYIIWCWMLRKKDVSIIINTFPHYSIMIIIIVINGIISKLNFLNAIVLQNTILISISLTINPMWQFSKQTEPLKSIRCNINLQLNHKNQIHQSN